MLNRLAIALSLCMLALLVFTDSPWTGRGTVYGAPGTRDFIEYWAAYQVREQGGNFYAPAQMLAIQKKVPEEMPSRKVLSVTVVSPL